MNNVKSIKEGLRLAQEEPRSFDTNDYVHDVSFLLSKLETAEKGLEQIKQFIDDERYTKAWKETIGTLDQLKE